MRKVFFVLVVLVLIPMSFKAQADDRVLPALADDVAQADANLGKNAVDPDKDKSGGKKQAANVTKDNFGQKVSVEAKRLRDADPSAKKGFGKWVSDQRRKNVAHSPNANANGNATDHGTGSASSGGAASDPRGQVPSQGGVSSGAGRPASPGHSGK